MTDLHVPLPWALDFCRAYNERNWLHKLIFKLVLGKYAYREFVGLWQSIEKIGFSPDSDYGLEDMDYHNDTTRTN